MTYLRRLLAKLHLPTITIVIGKPNEAAWREWETFTLDQMMRDIALGEWDGLL